MRRLRSFCFLVGCALALLLAGCTDPTEIPVTSSASSSGAGGEGGAGGSGPVNAPPWLDNAHMLVTAPDPETMECRTEICRHNENTDLISFGGAIYLVHRTAWSQILGDNSALHIYRSSDQGATFTETARIQAPTG